MKVCSVCKEEKPLTSQFFHRRSNSSDGFRWDCKECRKSYAEENKEKISEKRKKYYQENKEEEMSYNKKYYEENKGKILQQAKKYYEENREYIHKYQEKYREENREKLRNEQRIWSSKNPDYIKQYDKGNKDKRREYVRRNAHLFKQAREMRRARARDLPATLTAKEWLCIKKHFNYSCAYCGMAEKEVLEKWNEELHQDHFIAISKGGGYTAQNIIPACRSCNSGKRDRDFLEWYPGNKNYCKDRENKILEYLANDF